MHNVQAVSEIIPPDIQRALIYLNYSTDKSRKYHFKKIDILLFICSLNGQIKRTAML